MNKPTKRSVAAPQANPRLAKPAKPVEPPVIPTKAGDSVRLEKIENGFLAHHSSDGPGGYQTKTVYHPEAPVITIDTAKPKQTK